jgi:hypothetical protein
MVRPAKYTISSRHSRISRRSLPHGRGSDRSRARQQAVSLALFRRFDRLPRDRQAHRAGSVPVAATGNRPQAIAGTVQLIQPLQQRFFFRRLEAAQIHSRQFRIVLVGLRWLGIVPHGRLQNQAGGPQNQRHAERHPDGRGAADPRQFLLPPHKPLSMRNGTNHPNAFLTTGRHPSTSGRFAPVCGQTVRLGATMVSRRAPAL